MRRFVAATVFLALIAFPLLPQATTRADGAARPLGERIRSGRSLFRARGCAACHTVTGEGPSVGPDLARATVRASPMYGAAVMWNHVPLMARSMRERMIPWPDFRGEEVGDIFTYLHSLGPRRGEARAFRGEAGRGRAAFASACEPCHGPLLRGRRIGPDLGPVATGMRTEAEFASRMLRHAPRIFARARKYKVAWPRLTGAEMEDIFAFLTPSRPGK